ncbi:WD40 repeat-like protein [Abortiporus biennis]|nr:WD40 repeat-like protein [Abortiporus biennis]
MGRGGTAPAAETATYPPNDLTDLPTGAPGQAPASQEGGKIDSKRKQTLLSLLEALHELSKEEDGFGAAPTQQASFEDDRDVPTVDEHLQKVGAEAFNRFERRITNLDRELRNFANAARQLGSSVGILSSSFHLRERLAQILFLFRENAADLFPRKISHQSRDSIVNPNTHFKRTKDSRAAGLIVNPTVVSNIEAEDIPNQLKWFAADVRTFLDCLNEFPEFTDEGVNSSILSLEGDLRYWASCLKAYDGQFKYAAIQRYLHDLTSEMGEHLDSITSSLSIFIEIGVPTIRFAQKHAAANLLNLSTVATFFSAVTATTMQFSFDQTGTPLADSVNGFWFTSLVFSIGAAVNSLLGLTWKQAMYRSPGHRVPWWVLIWIKRSPLVFLVLSVACFSMGLVLFAYSSGQSRVVSTITTVFSACSCFGLAAVSTWFASERIIFNRHKGKKWLADVLSETKVKIYGIPGIAWFFTQPRAAIRKVVFWGRRKTEDVGEWVTEKAKDVEVVVYKVRRQMTSVGVGAEENGVDENDNVEAGLRSPELCASPEPLSPTLAERLAGLGHGHRPSDAGTLLPISEVASFTRRGSVDYDNYEKAATSSDVASIRPSSAAAQGSASAPPSTAQTRFANAVRSVMMLRSASASATTPFGIGSPKRQRTLSSERTNGLNRNVEPIGLMSRSRVAALVPKLRAMVPAQDLAAHTALVRHLQFSPNGKFLATSSWDRTSVVFRVGDPFTSHRILAHPSGFVGQVAWSPNGTTLLTKLNRGVKLWTEEGVCKKTIDRKKGVQSVAWLPGGDAFLSVESSDVTKLDLSGKILDTYHFDRMIVHDVAVTQDSQRMLCVGTLTASADGLHPSKCRAEKQIIAYNLDKKEIEFRVPVLHDVRDITLARNDHVALVSYENKAPPQLWKLDVVKDAARLSLRHTYMPKTPVDFAGPSYFGGRSDQLILCAGKTGDIHIWDRESAALLHHVRSQALGGDLTCVAWNHASDSFMFATGSHDGAVRIWTAPPASEPFPTVTPAPSRATTNAANTPRTSSPSPFDVDFRTDSPSTHFGNDSQDQFTESNCT